MTFWRAAWLLWVLYFVVLEVWALIRKAPGDTLSEQVWALRSTGSWLFSLILFVLAWSAWHFLFEGRR